MKMLWLFFIFYHVLWHRMLTLVRLLILTKASMSVLQLIAGIASTRMPCEVTGLKEMLIDDSPVDNRLLSKYAAATLIFSKKRRKSSFRIPLDYVYFNLCKMQCLNYLWRIKMPILLYLGTYFAMPFGPEINYHL